MKYRILTLLMIMLTNTSIATCIWHGDFIGLNRSCRPKQCQTPDSFHPPQYCVERNEKGWKKCLIELRGSSSNTRERSTPGVPYVSRIHTGLGKNDDSIVPEITIFLSHNTTDYGTGRDVDMIVNLTSTGNANLTGDPYYYRLPDQRCVKLKQRPREKGRNLALTYRTFEPCNNRCSLDGCYMYILHLIPLSLEHSAVEYYITVFNISKNTHLSKVSGAWKSAIAVSPNERNVIVVFEPIPTRLQSPGNVSYRIGIHNYPESIETSEPVQTYEIPRGIESYTHAFTGIDEGYYYVEVQCLVDTMPWPAWSRSQPFTVLHNNGSKAYVKDNRPERTTYDVNVTTSLAITAAFCVVILLTSCVYALHRKFPAKLHKCTEVVELKPSGSDYTVISEQEESDEKPKVRTPTICEKKRDMTLVEKFEHKFFIFNLD
ncbi:uncharacterized protein [Argopecten irradians]|uniref:uncharacterized protein n=1 Tax=Argopecten irradians TaxID=31199 RepID=UPI003711A20B